MLNLRGSLALALVVAALTSLATPSLAQNTTISCQIKDGHYEIVFANNRIREFTRPEMFPRNKYKKRDIALSCGQVRKSPNTDANYRVECETFSNKIVVRTYYTKEFDGCYKRGGKRYSHMEELTINRTTLAYDFQRIHNGWARWSSRNVVGDLGGDDLQEYTNHHNCRKVSPSVQRSSKGTCTIATQARRKF